MPEPSPRAANAGGFLIAAGAVAGTVIGLVAGEPTIGLLVGLGTGLVLVALLWLRDRRG